MRDFCQGTIKPLMQLNFVIFVEWKEVSSVHSSIQSTSRNTEIHKSNAPYARKFLVQSITRKCHILLEHVPQLLEKTGKGLFEGTDILSLSAVTHQTHVLYLWQTADIICATYSFISGYTFRPMLGNYGISSKLFTSHILSITHVK